MSVGATENVARNGLSDLITQPTTTSGSADQDMFLQLMVAQLRYQDPMNPADSGEFLAQNAQFTALEKMQAVADQTALVLGAQMAFGASSLVGRQVTYTDAAGNDVTGTVDSVTFDAAGPVLSVGGHDVPLVNVLTVSNGGGTSAPATSTTGSTTTGTTTTGSTDTSTPDPGTGATTPAPITAPSSAL
jgi:flagellar basal-body rod modification protein FlgD